MIISSAKISWNCTDSVGNIEHPAKLGVQFSGWQWTPIQELDKSTKACTILMTMLIKSILKLNIITVWANINCQRPSTLWVDYFNNKFGPFIGHHKNLQNILLWHGMSSFFFMPNGFKLVIRWLASLYMSLFLCLFHISSKCIADTTMWNWPISRGKTFF